MPADMPDSAQDPTPPVTDTNVLTKSRLSPLTMAVIFVIAVLAFAGGFTFSKKGFMVLPKYIPESVDIPLSYNSPSVYRASYVYAFNTKVAGIEEKDGKTILKTDLTGIDSLPEFVIDENTVIALIQNGDETRTKTRNLLKPGTSVYAYLSYNLKEKKWLTTRIAIIMPDVAKIAPKPSTLPASVSGNIKTFK